MGRLEIGYLLPTRDQAVRGEHEPGQLVGQARRAEALGVDSVWAGDSPVTRPRADALLLLAAVADATDRVVLGTAVLLPALRHPILLAHQLATLDRLSDGRLVAGMGAGFPIPQTEAQFAALDVGFKRRVSRMEESIDAMRRLWTGGPVSFKGEHFAFEDVTLAPPPSRPGGPPIWLAGGGVHALRRVARLADGWLPYPPQAKTYEREHQAIQDATTRSAAGARHIVARLATDDHDAALEEFGASVLPLLRQGEGS
ncbi:LLM class flavin-dependent oxidoreductase [Actinomadura rubrisoli]|uniref:TIGR03619 family F420-dependent LLM class oxidoreductase n=1 Tax=Actinomadura rubrisoli TaxID=2530368 RepID=A0A4R5B2D8_9ACTN|nr:TIGR03619 family F420-dependent LLM class oxidoreductase [Actinomadura rubrisoli]TDD79163.1 TIGR03619 family F420-dependent LLM class oxidoreductase [Actinomadura rubrisoli]